MLTPIKIVNGEQNKSNVMQDVNFVDFEFLSGKVSYGDSYIDGCLMSEETISLLLESKKLPKPNRALLWQLLESYTAEHYFERLKV